MISHGISDAKMEGASRGGRASLIRVNSKIDCSHPGKPEVWNIILQTK